MDNDPEALLRAPIEADALDVVATPDGSHTLYDARLGLHYRSTAGAASEARHVFLHSSGLLDRRPEDHTWRVAELGFGGAVTFCVAVQCALEADMRLVYHSVERRPVPPEMIARQHLEGPGAEIARRALERAPMAPIVHITSEDGRVTLVLHVMAWSDVTWGPPPRPQLPSQHFILCWPDWRLENGAA